MATPTREWVCLTILALLSSTLAMAHVVKPPKPDLNHIVKPPKPADLDQWVEPPKPAELEHVVKPPKADLDHEVKPPKLPGRKLQMHKSDEDQSSQMDGTGAPASGCGSRQTSQGWEEGEGGRPEGEGMYGGGHGSGGATFGFRNINPFPAFPFGAVVPEVSTWGGGGGYGGSNPDSGKDKDKGKGVECHCSNGYTMHYTMSPIHFPPMGIVDRDGPPPSPSP